jgi:hypothetical protein
MVGMDPKPALFGTVDTCPGSGLALYQVGHIDADTLSPTVCRLEMGLKSY